VQPRLEELAACTDSVANNTKQQQQQQKQEPK
jgi:hypothetical protein